MFQHKRFHATHFFTDQTEFFALNRGFANFYLVQYLGLSRVNIWPVNIFCVDYLIWEQRRILNALIILIPPEASHKAGDRGNNVGEVTNQYGSDLNNGDIRYDKLYWAGTGA